MSITLEIDAEREGIKFKDLRQERRVGVAIFAGCIVGAALWMAALVASAFLMGAWFEPFYEGPISIDSVVFGVAAHLLFAVMAYYALCGVTFVLVALVGVATYVALAMADAFDVPEVTQTELFFYTVLAVYVFYYQKGVRRT